MRYRNWITEIILLFCFLSILPIHIIILFDIIQNGLGPTLYNQGMCIFLNVILLMSEGTLFIGYVFFLAKYIEITEKGITLITSRKVRKMIEWYEIEKISFAGPIVKSTFLELKSGKREGLGVISNEVRKILLQKFETYKNV